MREMDVKKKERKEVEEGGEKEKRISSYLEDYCIAARHSSAPFRIFLAIIRVSDIGAAFSGRKRRGREGVDEREKWAEKVGATRWKMDLDAARIRESIGRPRREQ